MVDVAVMGAGSFGTAMAKVFAEATRPEPHRVRLWCRRQEVADQINATRINAQYLPEGVLPENLSATHDPEEAMRGAGLVVLAVPSQSLRANLRPIGLLSVGLVLFTTLACGAIGFVGLVVPHAMRFLVGVRHARLVPATALAGAVFLVLSDVVSRIVIHGQVLPIGVITALVGAPAFAVVMIRGRQR